MSSSYTNLLLALDYLESVIRQRIRYCFQKDKTELDDFEFPSFAVEESQSEFTKFIVWLDLSVEEFILLLLALAPQIIPNFFENIVSQHVEGDQNFPEFGGSKSVNGRYMLPTVSTALFVLAGMDRERRLELLELLDADHWLFKRGILHLETPARGEPLLNSRLFMDEEYVELFTKGYISAPKLSTQFPAQHIQTSQTWDDLIITDEVHGQLEDIQIWVQHHEHLMQAWGMAPKIKPGYRALFHGPPGTGKTLTASLLGKHTNRDVFRIDLSTVVSKYIGETEKNLANLFDKAQHRDWILFFDEADALFGKRTEVKNAHDRYANQEVSYLLQRIEDFPGLVILASNFKSNLDDAFLRRFNSVVKFPFPQLAERQQLWQTLLPPDVALEGDTALIEKAAQYELAGGSIINVIQYASLKSISREEKILRWADVQQGIRREIEKSGKLFRTL